MAKSNIHINPFPGIRSYEIHEDDLFFGRELQVKELILRLNKTRFLAIVGSSGCGKSSLIRAGLVPTLLKNKIYKSKTKWNLCVFKPGDDPIGNMAVALAQTDESDKTPANINSSEKEKIEKVLKSGEDGLTKVILEQTKNTNSKYLIVIDQFEELFRFKKTRTSFHSIIEATDFVNLILNTINNKEIPAYIVLSMRTDFLDDCTEYRGLTETINQGYYLVPRMNTDEIESAITGPVKVCGAEITKQLVRQLIDDVGDDPDQLPILQHALMRTWDYWKINRIGNKPIDISDYKAIGTMKEALSFHLEEIYNELKDPQSKHIAEKLFKALTDFGENNKGTRRPTQLSEICILADAKEKKVIKVIDSFRETGRAFLMPPYDVALNADSTVDISHESIMRVWVRLRTWVEEESRSAQLYLRLSKSAELFQEGKSGLWVNPELQLALKWREQNKPNATWAIRYDPAFDRAINFLDYSNKEFELEIARKENQQKRNLKRAKNFAIILGIASIISILFLIISLNLRFKAEASKKKAIEKEKIAIFETKRAEEQRKEAIMQKKISEQQQQIAEQQKIITEEQKQYAVKQQVIAEQQRKKAVIQKKKADEATNEAINARDEAETQRKEAVNQKQIADKEKIKAENSEKNTKRLRLLAIARSMAIQSAKIQKTTKSDLPALLVLQAYKFNKENQGIKNDPDIYNALANIADPKIIFREHEDGVRSVAVAENINKLFSCSDDGTVKIWDINKPEQKPEILNSGSYGKNGFRCLAISPNENTLAAGTFNGNILYWNIKQNNPALRTLDNHTSIVNKICFIDNNTLVSGSSDRTLRLWHLDQNDDPSIVMKKFNSKIISLSYCQQTKQLACGCENGEINLFNLENHNEAPIQIQSAGNPVLSLAFSSDGKILASGNIKGIINLWKLDDKNSKPVELIGHVSRVNELEFSPNGKTLGSCSYDGTIRIWNFNNSEEQPIVIDDNDSWVYDITFTPDGNRLVSAGADKTVRVFIIKPDILTNNIYDKISRNILPDEWNKYIGSDIEYEKTIQDLP
jgi:WD40 repeat protein/energy-coupling factor transporter ATP-binding protein EcfA2